MQLKDRTEASLALGGLYLTTLIWAGNIVIARGIHELIPPVALSFWRSFLALLIILPFGWPALWRRRDIIAAHWKWLLLLATLSVGASNTLLYLAAHTTEATNIGLINAAMPVVVLAMSRLILGTLLTRNRVIGVLAALAGILFIISRGNPVTLVGVNFRPGDLYMMANVCTWSLFSVLLRLHPIPLRPLEFLTMQILLGTAVVMPFYLAELAWVGPFVWTPEVWAPLAYVAIPQSILAYGLWTFGVQRLGPQVAASSAYLTPLFVALLAWLTLGEQPQLYHYLGGALVLSGVYLATRRA